MHAILALFTGLLNLAVLVRKKMIAKRYEQIFSKLGALVHQTISLHEEIESLVLAKHVSSKSLWQN